jgi:hypothetical protein
MVNARGCWRQVAHLLDALIILAIVAVLAVMMISSQDRAVLGFPLAVLLVPRSSSSATRTSWLTWPASSFSVSQYPLRSCIGLKTRHGPGPRNRSRGTVAKASTAARASKWAVRRNSSAYHCRANFAVMRVDILRAR